MAEWVASLPQFVSVWVPGVLIAVCAVVLAVADERFGALIAVAALDVWANWLAIDGKAFAIVPVGGAVVLLVVIAFVDEGSEMRENIFMTLAMLVTWWTMLLVHLLAGWAWWICATACAIALAGFILARGYVHTSKGWTRMAAIWIMVLGLCVLAVLVGLNWPAMQRSSTEEPSAPIAEPTEVPATTEPIVVTAVPASEVPTWAPTVTAVPAAPIVTAAPVTVAPVTVAPIVPTAVPTAALTAAPTTASATFYHWYVVADNDAKNDMDFGPAFNAKDAAAAKAELYARAEADPALAAAVIVYTDVTAGSSILCDVKQSDTIKITNEWVGYFVAYPNEHRSFLRRWKSFVDSADVKIAKVKYTSQFSMKGAMGEVPVVFLDGGGTADCLLFEIQLKSGKKVTIAFRLGCGFQPVFPTGSGGGGGGGGRKVTPTPAPTAKPTAVPTAKPTAKPKDPSKGSKPGGNEPGDDKEIGTPTPGKRPEEDLPVVTEQPGKIVVPGGTPKPISTTPPGHWDGPPD